MFADASSSEIGQWFLFVDDIKLVKYDENTGTTVVLSYKYLQYANAYNEMYTKPSLCKAAA